MKSDIRIELMHELKRIYNNKDFVCGTVAIAGSEKIWRILLDFIQTARQEGDDLSSDNLLLLAMHLRDEEDARNKATPKRKSIAAAML